jgi:flagellar L-ring protein precursor FlgH
MKKIIMIIALLMVSTTAWSQFTQAPPSLFSDVKAREIDDAVTILIVEDTEATNSAGTSMDRSDDVTLGGTFSAGTRTKALGNASASFDMNTGSDFRSTGQNTRNESFRTKLSARVLDVEANGNLIIRGQRSMKINGEEQTVTIEGTVRPVDILPNNSVYSYHVMDMRLTIEGDGNITEVQEPGLLTKFIRALF